LLLYVSSPFRFFALDELLSKDLSELAASSFLLPPRAVLGRRRFILVVNCIYWSFDFETDAVTTCKRRGRYMQRLKKYYFK
jgi:hypothetical protein